MASFLADMPLTPIEKETGSFLYISGERIKLRGHHVAQLFAQGYLEEDTTEYDAKYPYRHFYRLIRFTTTEQNVVLALLLGAIEAEAAKR